jgi:hypothetical protein
MTNEYSREAADIERPGDDDVIGRGVEDEDGFDDDDLDEDDDDAEDDDEDEE